MADRLQRRRYGPVGGFVRLHISGAGPAAYCRRARLRIGDLSAVWNLLFLVGKTLLVSFSFWYSSRLLLGRDYPSYPLDRRYAAFGRRWWPRFVGTAAPAAIGWTFLDITSAVHSSEILLGWLYLSMAAALLLFYVLRRRLFGVAAGTMIEDLRNDVDPVDRRRIRIIMGASFALLLLFMLFPVFAAPAAGCSGDRSSGRPALPVRVPAIITYRPMSRGMPAATLSALLLALVAGIWNGNHAVSVRPRSVVSSDRPDRCNDWTPGSPMAATRSPSEHRCCWSRSDGGIRAAYWTASTLVSGPDIGGGVHGPTVRGQPRSRGAASAQASMSASSVHSSSVTAARVFWSQASVLGQDFLSPVVAGSCFRTAHSAVSRSRSVLLTGNASSSAHGKSRSSTMLPQGIFAAHSRPCMTALLASGCRACC